MIKYTKEDNAFIRRKVKNFNAKRARGLKRGIQTTSERLKVYDIKQRYKDKTRAELYRELNALDKFSVRKTASYTTQKGANISKWQLSYLKVNTEGAKEELIHRRDVLKRKLGDMPGERLKIANINKKIRLLIKPVEEMTQSEVNRYRAIIRADYLSMPGKRKGGYRGFLSEVEAVMKRTGFTEEEIDEIYNKFKKLDPDQFLKMYEESSLISRVYDLADSPKYEHGMVLNTTPKKARKILEALVEESDDLVAKYKEL